MFHGSCTQVASVMASRGGRETKVELQREDSFMKKFSTRQVGVVESAKSSGRLTTLILTLVRKFIFN